ncbi:MAG TPA: DUF6325 family protein [Jatrophihabitans sp.]|jgi:uncharacterized membrane protein
MTTKLGPIEVLVISFPGSQFKGRIINEVADLVDRNVINVVDGLVARKDADGNLALVELDQDDLDEELGPLAGLIGDVVVDLLSDDDVQELAAGLRPGDAGAVLVFEHEWARGLSQAIAEAGGQLVSDVRVPGLVVDEVLAALDPDNETQEV